MDEALRYSPFNANGSPKLRNRKSSFERGGWLPFIVRHVEVFPKGILIRGVALDDKTLHNFGTLESLSIDRTRPIYFRHNPSNTEKIDFSYFANNAIEPTLSSLLDNCANEIELAIKTKSDR